MRLRLLMVFVAAALVAIPALAIGPTKRANEPLRLAPVLRPAPAPPVTDPFTPVFIVSSEATFRVAVQAVAQNASVQRDRAGHALVVAEVREHRLSDISRIVHDAESRCGGFFAFATRAEALAFVRDDQSVVALKRLPAKPYSIDNADTVVPWLGQVQEANILGTISQLSNGFRNRFFGSNQGRDAATWLRDNWLAMGHGRSDVSAELFTNCSNCGTQPSVILTVQGVQLPDEIVVLGAHLDSISNNGSGDNMLAPGADDDASGIATLTEIIRISLANGWRPRRTVKFMGYSAEEVGLRGSRSIAQSFKVDGKKVVGVLQLDMTNYRTAGAPDMRLITDFSNLALSRFTVGLFDTYLAPLGYTRGTYTCGYACSDHASWTSFGFPSTMMFEPGDGVGDFAYIHTINDTLPMMGNSAVNSVAFGKLGLVFLGEIAKTGAVGGNVLPSANFRANAKGYSVQFIDLSTDSDGTIADRRWDFGDGTSSTEVRPGKTYPARGTYQVTLTVTDNSGGSRSAILPVSLPSGLSAGFPPRKNAAQDP